MINNKLKNRVYVALLRGINVGGKNKIDMKLLQKTFEDAGMFSVTTYINSGNIVFINNNDNEADISGILEDAINKDFNLSIKVLIRSMEKFKRVIKYLPKDWKNDNETRSDVLFLWKEIDNKSLIDKLTISPGIDIVRYIPGAILWKADRKSISRSGKMKLAGSKLYRKMTIRNVNTVRKIFSIMTETEKVNSEERVD